LKKEVKQKEKELIEAKDFNKKFEREKA